MNEEGRTKRERKKNEQGTRNNRKKEKRKQTE